MERSGPDVSRRHVLRIAALSGVGLLAGGGLVKAVVRRAGFHRIRETRTQMGTLVEISVVHSDASVARSMAGATFDEMERLEGLLSRHREGTDIWRLNSDGFLSGPAPEVVEVLRRAVEYSAMTGGAFDVTVAPLLTLYSESFSRTGGPPSDTDLRRALTLVDFHELAVSEEKIALGKPGMAITVDGIAKGYIVDRAVATLVDRGAESVLVNAGGDMSSSGDGLWGDGWTVAIQDPRAADRHLEVLELRGESVATSGDYMQYLSADRRHHHIVDPRTGRSPDHTSAVSVVTTSAMAADALSTAVMVLGPREGLDLIDRLPDAEAMIVTKDQEVLRSKGLSRYYA